MWYNHSEDEPLNVSGGPKAFTDHESEESQRKVVTCESNLQDGKSGQHVFTHSHKASCFYKARFKHAEHSQINVTRSQYWFWFPIAHRYTNKQTCAYPTTK